MKVVIDPEAGLCTGVKRAIRKAEEELAKSKEVFSVGQIIHNRLEVERLERMGLRIVSDDKLEELRGKRLLTRTHGMPRGFFQEAKAHWVQIIDITCPIVRRSQRLVEEYFNEGYQIIIVGKRGHPEVIGLQGYCGGKAIVALSREEIQGVDFNQKTLLLAQTTISPEDFCLIREYLERRMASLEVVNTTCREINNRYRRLIHFAREKDVMIIVGGRNSSNTKLLFDLCRSVNPNSYWVESSGELNPNWFRGVQTIGISGGASTPYWQLEQIRNIIKKGGGV